MLTLLTESLWGDEGFSTLAVMRPFWQMLGVVMRDTAPPGFYVLGWLWGRVFGFSEAALRSLSLLLMMGAAVFAGLIVWQISKRRWPAVLTGLLAFFSPFSFSYAFEWRMYALLTFTIMGSIYFFMARKWRGYVLMTVLALYTHHLALFTVMGQGLAYLVFEFDWKKWKTGGKQLWPFWLVGLLYLPWVYPMYLQTIRVQGAGFWLRPPALKEVIDLMYRFITGGVAEEWRLAVVLLILVLVLGKQWQKIVKKWLEILLIVLMPVLLSWAVSYWVTPVFYDRYLLSVVLGMAVLIGLGVRRWVTAGLILLVIIYGWFSYQQLIQPKKRPFREFAAQVKQELRQGDSLINYNGRAHHLWETKYYGIPAPIWVPNGKLPLYVGTAQMKDEDVIKDLPGEAKRIGVITSEPVEQVELQEPWQRSGLIEIGELSLIWFER